MKHSMVVSVLLFVALLAANSSLLAQQQPDVQQQPKPQQQDQDIHQLRPPLNTAALLAKATACRQRGYKFLLDTQNHDGSWGSHDPKIPNLADFGFQLRNRGSQDAVRTACTAICAEALLQKDPRDKAEERALQNAIQELLLVRKFAFHPGESFCTWGYGYKLGFLNSLNNAEEGAGLEEEILAAAQSCIDGLVRFQQHEGGWGYYSGVAQDFESMSFNTAFFALSIHRGAKMGLKVPAGMVKDARRIVERQKVPDGSFVYSSSHRKNPSSMLKNLGAGSRTVSAALALHELGSSSKPDLTRSLEIFDNGENYLESGRKLIQPHSAVHQISGYFFFFGYNYATEVAALLGDEVPQERWDRFAWTMIRTQEENGSWWDTPRRELWRQMGHGICLADAGSLCRRNQSPHGKSQR